MLTEQKLIEKLRLIEALIAGTDLEGEKNAAALATERIKARLKEMQAQDPPVEYKFTLRDSWSRKVFVALLRRYDLKPYRYYRQRYTTVMARVPQSFVDDVLWPEFERINDVLHEYLDETTNRVIAETIHADYSEAEVEEDSRALPPGKEE